MSADSPKPGQRASMRCPYGSLPLPIRPELCDTFDGYPVVDDIYWIRSRVADGDSVQECIGVMQAAGVPVEKAARLVEAARAAPRERGRPLPPPPPPQEYQTDPAPPPMRPYYAEAFAEPLPDPPPIDTYAWPWTVWDRLTITSLLLILIVSLWVVFGHCL